jgi:hypothetical protein
MSDFAFLSQLNFLLNNPFIINHNPKLKQLSYFSLLITALGHIKLTDFGLSKMGLMSCKYFSTPEVNI